MNTTPVMFIGEGREERTSKRAFRLADSLKTLAGAKKESLGQTERQRILEAAQELEYLGLLVSSRIMYGWFEALAEVTAECEGFSPKYCAEDTLRDWEEFRDHQFREDFEAGVESLVELSNKLRGAAMQGSSA